MAKTDSKSKYRRLILIYSLVIIIPGTFLSILAFRGIHQNYYMANKVISQRLDRKSRYYFRTIENSINTYLDLFYLKNIIWKDSLFGLQPGSKAIDDVGKGIIRVAAAKEPGKKITFMDNPSLQNYKHSLSLNGVTGNFYRHLKNNIDFNSRDAVNKNPPYYDFYEDSVSCLLVTRIHPDYNISLVLNLKTLLRDAISVLEEKEGFKHMIQWRILDEYGNSLWSSQDFKGKNIVDYNNADFGHWTLQLEQDNHSPFAIISEAEEQYITAGLIFVLAVMGFGLVVTIRSLTRDYRLSQMKSDFVSTVSHEFKSPLTSIRMMSERLAEEMVVSEKRKKDYYQSMLAQSERLSHLVDNILDFSRMEKGRKTYNFEHANVVRLVREVIDYLLIRHREMGFNIVFMASEDPMIAMIDPQAIHQVLYNLIENAIKYSGDSKNIEVNIQKVKENAQIKITDQGIGISKKDQKKIFGQFFRVEKASRDGVKGSGIGLSIVREIIKAHQGRIDLISEIGEGSTFIVSIPLYQN